MKPKTNLEKIEKLEKRIFFLTNMEAKGINHSAQIERYKSDLRLLKAKAKIKNRYKNHIK